MSKSYFTSLQASQQSCTNLNPINKPEKSTHKGREYFKIGESQKMHGQGWKISRMILAISTACLWIFLIPLAIKPYRNLVAKLANEGLSGCEKVSLFVISNKENALVSVAKNAANYQNLPSKMRDDEDVTVLALKKFYNDQELINKVGKANNALSPLHYASDKMKANKKVALAAVDYEGSNYELLTQEMRDDEDVAIALVNTEYGYLIKNASEVVKNNKEVALAAVKADGSLYEYLSANMQDDEDVTIWAVHNDPRMFKFASDRMKDNDEVATYALEKNLTNFKHLSKRLQGDKTFVLDVLELNKLIYKNIISSTTLPPGVKKEECEKFLGKLNNIFKSMPKTIKNDKDIKNVIIENKEILESYVFKNNDIVFKLTQKSNQILLDDIEELENL